MGFEEINYDEFVDKQLIYRDDIYPVLGLAGESGELVELVKKAYRDGKAGWVAYADKDQVISELGDILFYLTCVAHVFDTTLDMVLVNNVLKLNARQEAIKAKALANAVPPGTDPQTTR